MFFLSLSFSFSFYEESPGLPGFLSNRLYGGENMKNGMKLFAIGAALVGAAAGIAAYRKYRDSYEELPEEQQIEDENEFEYIAAEDDDFTYYVEDDDQIFFYE